MRSIMPRFEWFLSLLLVVAGGDWKIATSFAEDRVPEAVQQPQPLSIEKIEEQVRETASNARLEPARSKNMHLADWTLAHPLEGFQFFSATLGKTFIVPQRKFVAVDPQGRVKYPFDADDLALLLADYDKSGWSDEQFLQAAVLFVHLKSTANQDGWQVLRKPREFMKIEFNMPQRGPAVEARKQAAAKIKPPEVQRDGKTVRVEFHAWHLIGGVLRKWNVAFDKQVHAEPTQLGRFGGGGYD